VNGRDRLLAVLGGKGWGRAPHQGGGEGTDDSGIHHN